VRKATRSVPLDADIQARDMITLPPRGRQRYDRVTSATLLSDRCQRFRLARDSPISVDRRQVGSVPKRNCQSDSPGRFGRSLPPRLATWVGIVPQHGLCPVLIDREDNSRFRRALGDSWFAGGFAGRFVGVGGSVVDDVYKPANLRGTEMKGIVGEITDRRHP